MITPTLAADLAAVAALIRLGWTQGASARTHEGVMVPTTSKDAVCWCLLAAVCVATRHDGGERYEAVLAALQARIGVKSLSAWNDASERTQADVLAMLEGIGAANG